VTGHRHRSADIGSAISPAEFGWICDYLYAATGIVLKDGKQTMVVGRLGKRLSHHGLSSYTEYFQRLSNRDGPEARIAIDLLTTNETYFFREPEHFTWLRESLSRMPRKRTGDEPVRIWCAASSSGEEPYSLAMLLADCLPQNEWQVLGTDISSRVLERARKALYPLDAAAKIPQALLRAYCLKGKGELAGYLAINPAVADRVRFQQLNLIQPLPSLGKFDQIWLRNVMIYFDQPTKSALVNRLIPLLKPGGYMVVSHSETLNGLQDQLNLIKPSIYRAASG
jgi:chemotaxis protein methyltransferase CheR